MGSNDGMQRQRHGVTKNLVEGFGGVLVGAAAILLLRGLFKGRGRAPVADAAGPATDKHEIPSEDTTTGDAV